MTRPRYIMTSRSPRLAAWCIDPNDLKLVTAAFVFAALILPEFLGRRAKA